MKNLRLKICGLRDNIEDVVRLEPDYAGFIFYERSPRYVGIDFNMPVMPDSIKKVGVFVNESFNKLLEFTEKYKLDFVQLHGNESPELCAKLKSSGIGIIKAFPVGKEFDFRQLDPYEPVVDYYLFDTKTSAYGGSGRTFDWNLLKSYDLEKQFLLGGGIGLENIDDLAQIDLAKVHALDVNSRFEIRPGLKNITSLQKFIGKLNMINPNKQISNSK